MFCPFTGTGFAMLFPIAFVAWNNPTCGLGDFPPSSGQYPIRLTMSMLAWLCQLVIVIGNSTETIDPVDKTALTWTI
jgi:hypothetical protein